MRRMPLRTIVFDNCRNFDGRSHVGELSLPKRSGVGNRVPVFVDEAVLSNEKRCKCAPCFSVSFLSLLEEHSDTFFVIVVVISELPQLFDSEHFAVPVVEAFAETQDTAERNVPAVDSCGVEGF